MKNEKLLLFILAVIQFAHLLDFMIIMPLGAQFMEIFSISPQQFSLMVSSYALSAFVMGILSALYIDRFDRKQALLWINFGFAAGTLACAFVPNYYLFLAARSLAGAFGGILGALVLSIVADVIPLERRASAMGIVMTSFSVASVAGVPLGLYLAAEYSWRLPFIIISLLAFLLCGLIYWLLPAMRGHLSEDKQAVNPFRVIGNIFSDPNQLRALIFTTIMMLGHFIIIPFIAPYMQLNIGFSDHDVTYIYLFGGITTAVLLPLFGRIADIHGHAKVFTIASIFALVSIYGITNLPPVPMFIALLVTSSYFIVASGRSVPATTMVTAVVRPESRGSFMSIRSSANEMALGLASLLAGLIVVENPDGSLGNYEYVGYIGIIMSIVAIILGRKLKTIA
ncbi:MAG: MFS transporter [Bacteroidota bacterium]